MSRQFKKYQHYTDGRILCGQRSSSLKNLHACNFNWVALVSFRLRSGSLWQSGVKLNHNTKTHDTRLVRYRLAVALCWHHWDAMSFVAQASDSHVTCEENVSCSDWEAWMDYDKLGPEAKTVKRPPAQKRCIITTNEVVCSHFVCLFLVFDHVSFWSFSSCLWSFCLGCFVSLFQFYNFF